MKSTFGIPKVLSLKKSVEYFVAPGMIIQRDQIYGKIFDVTLTEKGDYIARIEPIIQPSDLDDWDKMLTYYIKNGWQNAD